ncbi:rubredoxin [Eubacterium aggregans]|uniref:rubredoxin n=1 Tax=Eubacterium aggregans TaxID=81409 RepID=UPI003F2BB858
MQEFECHLCGYIYNPELGDSENNIAPGTAFEDLPQECFCPTCGIGVDVFLEKREVSA